MNPRRRSTVHDLAALRLHRDGTRVPNVDATDRPSRRAKYAVRDARGNWIAQDAGGLGNVKQRRSASHPDGDEELDGDEEDEAAADEVSPPPPRDKGKGKAREDEASEGEDLNPRARKRRRFDEDFSYLASHSSSALAQPTLDEDHSVLGEAKVPSALPVPSSDLLKCLHYFASTYYTAMGQLYDATREARKRKKARRLEKAKAVSGRSRSHDAQSEDLNNHEPQHSSGEEEGEPSDEEVEELMNEDHVEEQRVGDGSHNSTRGRRKKGSRQSRPMQKDMYKIFDGSALMAIGMLFQEHVAEMVKPRVPEGWEEEMALVEREVKAEVARVRNAKRMRDARNSVKGTEEQLQDDVEPDVESEEDESSDETESDSGDQDEDLAEKPTARNVALKQHSSIAGTGSSDESEN
ncbi:hypothetical protein C8Q70DRAFT_1045604 [Cubamyces menziesii]|nr:hypothetical protein C8Q70DRAFT_1045604 [Cubamyces menziesii]